MQGSKSGCLDKGVSKAGLARVTALFGNRGDRQGRPLEKLLCLLHARGEDFLEDRVPGGGTETVFGVTSGAIEGFQNLPGSQEASAWSVNLFEDLCHGIVPAFEDTGGSSADKGNA